MNVPNFIYERVVDDKGFLTAAWQKFFNQLINEMNQNLGEEGLVMPSQPTTNIALLTNALNGAMVYDATINQPKINVNGTFKTIVTV
jgi:hypothetical protein